MTGEGEAGGGQDVGHGPKLYPFRVDPNPFLFEQCDG